MDIGGIFPFTNPAGILVFAEEPVQNINLKLVYDDKLEVRKYELYVCLYVCTNIILACVYNLVCMHTYSCICNIKS